MEQDHHSLLAYTHREITEKRVTDPWLKKILECTENKVYKELVTSEGPLKSIHAYFLENPKWQERGFKEFLETEIAVSDYETYLLTLWVLFLKEN